MSIVCAFIETATLAIWCVCVGDGGSRVSVFQEIPTFKLDLPYLHLNRVRLFCLFFSKEPNTKYLVFENHMVSALGKLSFSRLCSNKTLFMDKVYPHSPPPTTKNCVSGCQLSDLYESSR